MELSTEKPEIEQLLGKTFTQINGLNEGSEEIIFTTNEGEQFSMHHDQDCCEEVLLESIDGDTNALIGHPILVAEESKSENITPEGLTTERFLDSFTWTFYRLATVKGHVVLRWLGTSNGYYSEKVTIKKIS